MGGLGDLEAPRAKGDFRGIENRPALLHVVLEAPVITVTGAIAERVLQHRERVKLVRQDLDSGLGLGGVTDEIASVARNGPEGRRDSSGPPYGISVRLQGKPWNKPVRAFETLSDRKDERKNEQPLVI